MLEVIPKIPRYVAYRQFGGPRILPMNIVVSICYRCNSRCKTCNVWKKIVKELSVDEYARIFKSIGEAPTYMTFSGGEPFIRKDIADIVTTAYNYCKPSVITIPTNGIVYQHIGERVEQILKNCPKAQVGINLSLDGVGHDHDAIRQVRNNYERSMKTYESLKELKKQYKNLTISIHTVISKFNVEKTGDIFDKLTALEPDSYISEIAEERIELDTMGLDITPDPDQYEKAADILIEKQNQYDFKGFAKITQSFRRQYYQIVKQTLREKRQVIPCYAGWASAHIAPDGDVWTCCIRAEPVGNLRESDYDFSTVWFSEKAEELRRSIKAGECHCPMANAMYTNMLMDPGTVTKVAAGLVKRDKRKPKHQPPAVDNPATNPVP